MSDEQDKQKIGVERTKPHGLCLLMDAMQDYAERLPEKGRYDVTVEITRVDDE